MTTKILAHDDQGTPIREGDTVCFKRDIEQYGRAVRFEHNSLVVSCWDADAGERYEQLVSPSRCSVEG